jgi:hypothetical protein
MCNDAVQTHGHGWGGEGSIDLPGGSLAAHGSRNTVGASRIAISGLQLLIANLE